jgi:mono/diheme cytochrome c family protein
MRNRLLFFLIILILSGWLLSAAVQEAASLTPAETPPTASGTAEPAHDPPLDPTVVTTPTIDRLAAPPTVENPTQADEGAQLFWLHCQPCHGDVGQGLTEDWRNQYPEEDRNCWNSGCHGNRPYENGFTLPTSVPAVTGENSLETFETVGQLYNFISAAMPYQNPGYLSEEEYLAMTAFLARAHGVWDGTPLNPDNVGDFRLSSSSVTATPEPSVTPRPTESEGSSENEGEQDDGRSLNIFVVGIAAGVIGSLVFILVLAKRRIG